MTDQIDAYLQDKETKWEVPFRELLDTIHTNLPKGFAFTFQYGMPSFVVPLTVFPEGYLKDSKTPLPFISIAAQKNHLALYHMGIYGDKELMDWFEKEYPRHMTTKLNMGKSCIRFTNPRKIPYELIGELVRKMSVEDWIVIYKEARN